MSERDAGDLAIPGKPPGTPPVASPPDVTPARVFLGRTGTSLRTRQLLELRADHATAKDAVRGVRGAGRGQRMVPRPRHRGAARPRRPDERDRGATAAGDRAAAHRGAARHGHPASMSAYLGYRPRRGHTDADRNLISNIHDSGIPPVQAADEAAVLTGRLLAARTSGVSALLAATPASPIGPKSGGTV